MRSATLMPVPNETFFVESANSGPGYLPNQRNMTVESIISETESDSRYSMSMIFGGVPSWIDTSYPW